MPGGKNDEAERARRFRSALEELGPTFAKLGHILSTRPDLLPAAVVAELADLQDHVAPLTEAEVVAVMEAELKVPWGDVFASIEPDPLASGTIAQVHRATLVGGERVVVKVQRPTAETEIRQDLGLLRRFAAKAAGRPSFQQVVDVPAVIDHLSSSLVRELDFRHEAANIERMREVLAPFSRLSVPEVIADLSAGRLLVLRTSIRKHSPASWPASWRRTGTCPSKSCGSARCCSSSPRSRSGTGSGCPHHWP
jgi:ubiquinone biosynthesis protein